MALQVTSKDTRGAAQEKEAHERGAGLWRSASYIYITLLRTQINGTDRGNCWIYSAA